MFMKHTGIIDGLGRTIIVEEAQAIFDAIYAPRGWVTATQGEADAFFGAPNPDDSLVTKTQMDTAIAGSVGSSVASIVAGLSAAATGTANRAALLDAATRAMAAKKSLILPAGTFDVDGDEILIDSPLIVVGQGTATVLHKTTKARAIFKVTAPGCEFRDFRATGSGLDVTGYGLNGSDSFRRHVAIWATLTAHDLVVDNVSGQDLMMVVYMRDYWPGETVTYSSSGLQRPKITNVYATGVLFGIHGGPVIDPRIENVSGSYTRPTGTPTNGDTFSPPHMVYIDSDSTHRSSGGKIGAVSATATSTYQGGPLKLKYYDGLLVSGVIGQDTGGLAELQEVTDIELQGLLSLNDKYPASDGRGSIWLVDCQRVKIVEPKVRFASSTHGPAFWENSGTSDTSLVRPRFAANLSVTDTNHTAVSMQGTRSTVLAPFVEILGGQVLAGVYMSGVNGRIIDPYCTGKSTYGVYCRSNRQVVDYDPSVLLPSRTVSGAVAVGVHADATSAGTVVRDRSVGQATPFGFVDEFDRGSATVTGLSTTDYGKTWRYADSAGGLTGTSSAWQVTSSNTAKYIGASARALAVVDGGGADGSVKTTIAVNASDTGSGIAGRVTDWNNYVAVTFNFSSGDHKLSIQKRVAGTRTILAQSAGTVTVGDVVELVMSGTSFSVNLNGTQVIAPQTITDVPSTNYHGLLGTTAETTLTYERVQFA